MGTLIYAAIVIVCGVVCFIAGLFALVFALMLLSAAGTAVCHIIVWITECFAWCMTGIYNVLLFLARCIGRLFRKATQ